MILAADPFDTTDHNQDGYGVYGAERLIDNVIFFGFFGDASDHTGEKRFAVVSTAQKQQTYRP